MAEASVYLRYGKHDRAIKSLRAILSQEPGHREALEKLGEALVATDDTANAVTAFSRAAEAARAEGDDAGFESLRGRIEAARSRCRGEPDPGTRADAGGERGGVHEAAAEGDQHLEDIDDRFRSRGGGRRRDPRLR